MFCFVLFLASFCCDLMDYLQGKLETQTHIYFLLSGSQPRNLSWHRVGNVLTTPALCMTIDFPDIRVIDVHIYYTVRANEASPSPQDNSYPKSSSDRQTLQYLSVILVD